MISFSISSSEAKKAIEERLAPVGQVCVEGEGCATTGSEVTAAPVEKKSLPKVQLSEGSEHTVNMLNMGPGGTMVFDPPVIKVSKGDTVHFKSVDLSHKSLVNLIDNGTIFTIPFFKQDKSQKS